MNNFICAAFLATIAPSAAFAIGCPPGSPGGPECFTVSAPDESEPGSGMGGIAIDGIIGSGSSGGSGVKATSKTVNEKGKKQAEEAKEKKEKEGNADETSVFDSAIGAVKDRVDRIISALESLANQSVHVDFREQKKVIKRDPETGNIIEETEYSKCKSAGLNDDKPSCTQLRMIPWTDPLDGKKKVIYNFAEVVTIPNPRPTALTGRYKFKVISAFSIVAETPAELADKLREINGI